MSPFSDEPPSLGAELLGERYRLEAVIGHGGMGVVHRAVDTTLHRPVAIKLVQTSDGSPLDEETSSRFLREAKNTARLQHENIVDVYDMGRTGAGDLYLVMELLEGESLSARIRRGVWPDIGATVHIARQLCAALHVAHAAGIVHRDLKPANVMIVPRTDDAHFIKVLDFGVAKSYGLDQQTKLTRSGMLVGTIEYMAPEQILGQRVDARTDVYSLGIVLYKLLARRAPFRTAAVPALIHAHLNVIPEPPSRLRGEVTTALDRITLRCLEKRPDHRYATMGEVARALEEAVAEAHERLPSLAYDDDDEDPYAHGVSTRVLGSDRAPAPAPPPSRRDDTGATVREGRATGRPSAPGAARKSEAPKVALPADDTATTKRRAERSGRADPPRECARCGMINSPFAIACAGCETSLAALDQQAVRERRGGSARMSSAPPSAASLPSERRVSDVRSARPPGIGGLGERQTAAPESAWREGRRGVDEPSQTRSTGASAWHRLLTWAGLRSGR